MKEVRFLERFPNLTEFNLAFNRIVDLDLLVEELSKVQKLRILDLRGNKFNHNFNFSELVPNSSCLKSLEIIEQ